MRSTGGRVVVATLLLAGCSSSEPTAVDYARQACDLALTTRGQSTRGPVAASSDDSAPDRDPARAVSELAARFDAATALAAKAAARDLRWADLVTALTKIDSDLESVADAFSTNGGDGGVPQAVQDALSSDVVELRAQCAIARAD